MIVLIKFISIKKTPYHLTKKKYIKNIKLFLKNV